MADTNSEINNLMLELSSVRKVEDDLKKVVMEDASTIGDIKKIEMDLKYKQGKFDETFAQFMRAEGVPERGHILEVINHFWMKSKKTIIT